MKTPTHDNITTALAILHFHEKDFALTGGAMRRLLYLVQGRVNTTGASWVTGFRRLAVTEHIRPDYSQTVFGHPTWRLTAKGRARLLETGLPAHSALTANATDPFALLEDAERYRRTAPLPPDCKHNIQVHRGSVYTVQVTLCDLCGEELERIDARTYRSDDHA